MLGWGCDFFEQVGNGEGPGSGVTTPTVISMPGRSTFGISAASWNSLVLTRPVDDDWKAPATWVRASVADATVGEAGGRFKVGLSAALPYDVTVDWSAEAGTAGSDDVTLGGGTATVPAGAKSVEVDAPVRDDSLDEDAETFAVVLRDASDGVQLDRSQATVTITDDDAPPSVGVKAASVAEGDTSLTDAPVKVRLSEASGKPVSVAFATADGTAVSPGDYAPASGRLTIAPGDVEGVVAGKEIDGGQCVSTDPSHRHRQRRRDACHIGAPGFEPGTSPTRTARATRLRHAPKGSESSSRSPGAKAGSGGGFEPSAGDRAVVADGQAGDQGLERLVDPHALARRVALQAGALDLLGLGDHVVDEVGVAIEEVRPDRVEVGLHEGLHEGVPVGLGHEAAGYSTLTRAAGRSAG